MDQVVKALVPWNLPEYKEKEVNKMKYLVTMELMGTPPATSPQEMVQWLEQIVIPSEEAMQLRDVLK